MQTLPYAQRQTAARQEFAQWRERNPQFSSKELLDAWASIRRAWGLSQPPTPRTPR